LQLTVAAALVHGDMSLQNRSYNRYLDKRVQSLSKRISVARQADLDAMLPDRRPAKVLITTGAGVLAQAQVELPPGEPARPLTWDELAAKGPGSLFPSP